MKSTDIAALIFISSISILIAYFIADAVIGKPSSESATVKTATPITAEVETPDPTIFNKDAINPTVEIVIGDGQKP